MDGAQARSGLTLDRNGRAFMLKITCHFARSTPRHTVGVYYKLQDDEIEYKSSKLCLPPCSFYMSTMRKIIRRYDNGMVGVGNRLARRLDVLFRQEGKSNFLRLHTKKILDGKFFSRSLKKKNTISNFFSRTYFFFFLFCHNKT